MSGRRRLGAKQELFILTKDICHLSMAMLYGKELCQATTMILKQHLNVRQLENTFGFQCQTIKFRHFFPVYIL